MIPEIVSKSLFTYGIKGGVGFKIADNTSLFSEATYLNYASFKNGSYNYDKNNFLGITAGLKFNFYSKFSFLALIPVINAISAKSKSSKRCI